MPFEQRDGEGALFVNKKDGNDNRPDWKGSITLDGKKHYIAAWLTTPKSRGPDFLKLKRDDFEEGRLPASAPAAPRPPVSTPAATGEAKPPEDLPF